MQSIIVQLLSVFCFHFFGLIVHTSKNLEKKKSERGSKGLKMVEIIETVILEVAKCLAPPTERQFNYLRNYTINIENLKTEIEKLKDDSASIQHAVDEAKRKGEKIERNIKKWLASVDKIIIEAEKFIANEDKANKRCFKRLCPNLKTRRRLSKEAVRLLEAIVKLREEVDRFGRISYRTIPDDIWLKSSKGYEAFESRLSTLKSIQNALTDVSVSVIGVYGMGGIGKTTLVKEIARQARDDKLFDLVVFSEISQTPDIKKIQGEIAEKLGLELSEEAESRRASRLYERLMNEKNILLILDNIWKHLDLERVGIPFGDDHKGCKLLLTTRDRNVLLNMGSKNNFLIGNLNEEEAWRLFQKMVGDDVENRKLKSTATNVAKACGGLPIALTTVARALRTKSLREWKNALRELQVPSVISFEGVPAEACSTIELSYKYLSGEQLKKTFLLCSLITPASVKDLFKYSMGLGVFERVYKLEDAHNKLYALVNELRDSCLLLEDGSSKTFSMHDVVRDVAISIACRDKNAFVVRNEDVWKWPDAYALKKCFAISLIDCCINDIPKELESPQLEFLLVNPKDSFVELNIPENFFEGLKQLQVVALTRMRLLSLPSSIDLLVNIQTLCLDQCLLGDIAMIGKLKNLEILSFVESDIVQLPEALGQLTKLRLLDLTDCFQLKFIAPNVISSFTLLEELYMGNCIIEWEVESANSERSNASLDELMHLPRLTTLEIDVKNDSILPEGFLARKLEGFKISIGEGSFEPPTYVKQRDWFKSRHFLIGNHESLKTLKLKLDSMAICSKKLQGINNVEYLYLDKLQGNKNVLFELDTKGFSQLKHLHVQNNRDFLCVVDSMDMVACDAFPLLESLTLINVINMKRICIDRLKVESFNELKTIQVENFYWLSDIFWLSTTKCLPRLERIAVINCINMEVIFAIGVDADVGNINAIEKIEFAQLKSLSLGYLPKLTSFCCEVDTASESPNRQELQEDLTAISCSNEVKLDTSTLLFNEKVVLPHLEALELSGMNVDKIWHYNQLSAMFPRFQNLTRMVVWRCPKLKYIFSGSMIRSLTQLQHLEIRLCQVLEEIISEDRTDQVTPCFVFPRVTTLILHGLTELRYLYPGMHTSEWPALEDLLVVDCDKIKLFTAELSQDNENYQLDIPAHQPMFSFEKILPRLKKLTLHGKDVRMILQGNFPQHLFGSLKMLEISNDDSACFSLGLLERFHNLESLILSNCSYKEVFSYEGYLEKHVEKGKFALIKSLELNNHNHLKQLWKQDSKLDSILQYLESLLVFDCQNLFSLWPSSSVTFRNLTKLQVFGCKKLMNLVTSSTAKSLEQLVWMKLYGCRTMTEVVISYEEDGAANLKEEIVFSKLKTLTLSDLNSLTSFCSGNYTFNFPALQNLHVVGCPKMKIFTAGGLKTPPGVNIWYGGRADQLRWANNDLNTTIQQLHAEKLLERSSFLTTQYT